MGDVTRQGVLRLALLTLAPFSLRGPRSPLPADVIELRTAVAEAAWPFLESRSNRAVKPVPTCYLENGSTGGPHHARVCGAGFHHRVADDVHGMSPPRRRQLEIAPGYVIELVATGVAYLLLAKLGLMLASMNPSASPVWPPTGFALAMVLLRGHRVWPALFVAALVANATTAGSFATSIVIALRNTLEALVGGYLIKRWCGGTLAFDTPVNVAKFAVISVGPGALISATMGVTALRAGG